VLLSGKRRACGSSGINIIPLPDDGNESVIATSGPTPGWKVVITFDAQGKVAGDYVLTAGLRSNLTAGTTSARSDIHVGP
jgi:hypothetical protein